MRTCSANTLSGRASSGGSPAVSSSTRQPAISARTRSSSRASSAAAATDARAATCTPWNIGRKSNAASTMRTPARAVLSALAGQVRHGSVNRLGASLTDNTRQRLTIQRGDFSKREARDTHRQHVGSVPAAHPEVGAQFRIGLDLCDDAVNECWRRQVQPSVGSVPSAAGSLSSCRLRSARGSQTPRRPAPRNSDRSRCDASHSCTSDGRQRSVYSQAAPVCKRQSRDRDDIHHTVPADCLAVLPYRLNRVTDGAGDLR